MSEDSLALGMVQDSHPTVPSGPAHLGCSGCPEDGVRWECLPGQAALSQVQPEQFLMPRAGVLHSLATAQDQHLQMRL